MKSKLSWIPFVPLALLGCFLKIGQGLLPEGSILGLSNLALEYLYLGCVALIFVFAVIFTAVDKKIAAYYLPRRNIFAGIVGLVLALLLAADGANELFRNFSSGKVDVLGVVGDTLQVIHDLN